MTKRILNLGLLLALAGAVGMAGTAAAADTWTVKLAGGDTHEGALVRLEPGRYLLQTDGRLLELTDDDIDPVTFRDHDRADAAPKRPVIEALHYDELHADGTVTLHWETHVANDSRQAITELRFGLAPWERAHADKRHYRDPFGNVLVPVYDPPRERWAAKPEQRVQVTIPLAVPVAPGETMTINGDETTTWIKQENKEFRYASVGDFAEDRLIWRKVRLPHGAEITGITPEPTARFEQDGYEYVMWRRYYVKGETTTLEVRYTLD
jgi:hypothetical protein